MILIIKNYYPDYDDGDCDCGCSSGTDVIERVLDLATDKTEAELMQEYNDRLESMVKTRKAFKPTTRVTTLNGWKYEERNKYPFYKFLVENYNNKPLDYITVSE